MMTSEASTTQDDDEWVFSNLRYICSSTGLITDSLKQGFDIAQLPNGDIIVTEVRTVTVRYVWDKNKQKMVKVSKE
jgi:hypothetical protein